MANILQKSFVTLPSTVSVLWWCLSPAWSFSQMILCWSTLRSCREVVLSRIFEIGLWLLHCDGWRPDFIIEWMETGWLFWDTGRGLWTVKTKSCSLRLRKICVSDHKPIYYLHFFLILRRSLLVWCHSGSIWGGHYPPLTMPLPWPEWKLIEESEAKIFDRIPNYSNGMKSYKIPVSKVGVVAQPRKSPFGIFNTNRLLMAIVCPFWNNTTFYLLP